MKPNRLLLVVLGISIFSFSLWGAIPAPFEALLSAIDKESYYQDMAVLTGEADVMDPQGNPTRIKDRHAERELKLARKFLGNTLRSFGLEVKKEHFEVNARDADGVNLYADMFGSESPEEIIELGAHYDTTNNGKPGANDNASGVCAVLAIARAFFEQGIIPRRTIRLVFFDAEEKGIQGSRVHFLKARQRKDRIKAFINVDMISHSPGGGKFAAFDPGSSGSLARLIRDANKTAELEFELEKWTGYVSDHIRGENLGIPSMSIFEDARDEDGEEVAYDPNNHSRWDTLDQVNIPYAVKMTKLIAATTLLATFPVQDVLKPKEVDKSVAIPTVPPPKKSERVWDLVSHWCASMLEWL